MSKNSTKTLFQAIGYALLFHIIAIAVSAIVFLRNKPISQAEVILQLPTPTTESLIDPVPLDPQPIRKQKIPSQNILDPHPQPKPQPEPELFSHSVPPDTTYADTAKKFDRLTFFKPIVDFQAFDKNELDSADTITTIESMHGSFFEPLDTTRFGVLPGPFPDRVQRDMEQQNLGHPRPLPLTDAIGKGAKYLSDLFNKEQDNKPVRLDFVPNEAELDILETLWESNATDQQIYAALDTSIRLTAEDLNGVMKKLEKKGLVKRKLVSPRNEFTFPVGKVEMSAKNRRNRVYLYESRIDSRDVVRYLQAVLYETEYGQKRAAADSTRNRIIAGLKAKIMRLIEKSG